MKGALSGRLALDSSVLVELTFSTDLGAELLNLILDGRVQLHTTEIAEAELHYILRGRVGKERAEERVTKLKGSGYLTIESVTRMIKIALSYKCERAISLSASA